MKKAFTLIELLVVMAIMGILTIITVSQFTTAKTKAGDSQRKADLSSVSKALMMYYADYDRFPATIDLTTGGAFTDGTTDPGGLYMKVMPKENNQVDYPYVYATNGTNKFIILGHLKNTQDSDGYKKGTSTPRTITCGGRIYNFGFTSPNISLDEITDCTSL